MKSRETGWKNRRRNKVRERERERTPIQQLLYVQDMQVTTMKFVTIFEKGLRAAVEGNFFLEEIKSVISEVR